MLRDARRCVVANRAWYGGSREKTPRQAIAKATGHRQTPLRSGWTGPTRQTCVMGTSTSRSLPSTMFKMHIQMNLLCREYPHSACGEDSYVR